MSSVSFLGLSCCRSEEGFEGSLTAYRCCHHGLNGWKVLHAGSSKHDKVAAVDEVITKLGLTTCQNNLVGGVLSRGISGGEVISLCLLLLCTSGISKLIPETPKDWNTQSGLSPQENRTFCLSWKSSNAIRSKEHLWLNWHSRASMAEVAPKLQIYSLGPDTWFSYVLPNVQCLLDTLPFLKFYPK